MADDVARAVGAGSMETVTIGGKQCTLRPVTVRELTEVERYCLKQYKRQLLETFSDNLDLVPEADVGAIISRKIDEVSLWDIGNLPTRDAYDHRSITLTDKLRAWVQGRYEIAVAESNGKDVEAADREKMEDRQYSLLTVAALDAGEMSGEEYQELTGKIAQKASVGYVNWYITGCYDGMVTFVWAAFKPDGVSREEVASMPLDDLILASREIERLTVPAVGNG